MELSEAVQYIKSNSEKSDDTRLLYVLNTNVGKVLLRIWNDNGTPLNGCQYKRLIEHSPNKFYPEFLWSISNPSDFISNFFQFPSLHILQLKKYTDTTSMRLPKELKKMKPTPIPFFPKKCTFRVYYKDNSVYINAPDFFSPLFRPPSEDSGKPLSYILNKYFNKTKSRKFIYDDSWGSVVLRQQAWLKIENIQAFRNYSKDIDGIHALQDFFQINLLKHGYNIGNDTYWLTFIENLYKYIKSIGEH